MKTNLTRERAIKAYGWLNEKNLVKFDKETRKAIIGICRALKEIASAYAEDRKTVQDKVFADQMEALEKRSQAIAEYQSATSAEERQKCLTRIGSYKELIPLDKEFSELMADMDKEEVEIDIPLMDEDKFVDGCGESDIPVSMAILDDLAPFFKAEKQE